MAALRAVAAEPLTGRAALLEKVVRPEFRGDVYVADAGDLTLQQAREQPCTVNACDQQRGKTRTWCGSHYGQWLRLGRPAPDHFDRTAPKVQQRPPRRICDVTSCGSHVNADGWCTSHARAWHRQRAKNTDLTRQQFIATAPPRETRTRSAPARTCAVHVCDRKPEPATSQWCAWHRRRWACDGKPPAEVFNESGCPAWKRGAFDVGHLPEPLRLEIQFALQQRLDEQGGKTAPDRVQPTVEVLWRNRTKVTSLLDRPLHRWWDELAAIKPRVTKQTLKQYFVFLSYAYEQLKIFYASQDQDAVLASDEWDLRALGLGGTGVRRLRFDDFRAPWLNPAAKRMALLQLSTNTATTVTAKLLRLRRFGVFLHQLNPPLSEPEQVTRQVVERYYLWLRQQPLSNDNRQRCIHGLRELFDQVRLHGWAELPANAVVRSGDTGRYDPLPPRALDSYVMAQIDRPGSLEQLPDDGMRALVEILIDTGLRLGDSVALRFSPLELDSTGKECLRFWNHKMKREERIPVSPRVVAAIHRQQAHVRATRRVTSPWLFPGKWANQAAQKHASAVTVGKKFTSWIRELGVRDVSGNPVHVTPHQLRHTLATTMINEGVPEEVVRQLLCHSSAEMTKHYARISDRTLRTEFERYRTQRIDVEGRLVYDASGGTPGDDAEWMRERLNRAKQALPNGSCGRPVQQDCPHANPCLTCPDFLTDPTFLPVHEDQLRRTRDLLQEAQSAGRLRLAEKNEQTAATLERMVHALRTPEATDATS
jgi:site-specific recombinase XerD